MIRSGQRPRALVLAGLAILGALVWGALAGTTREHPPEDGPRVSDRPVVGSHVAYRLNHSGQFEISLDGGAWAPLGESVRMRHRCATSPCDCGWLDLPASMKDGNVWGPPLADGKGSACGCRDKACTNPDAGACTCCNPVGCHPTEAGR